MNDKPKRKAIIPEGCPGCEVVAGSSAQGQDRDQKGQVEQKKEQGTRGPGK